MPPKSKDREKGKEAKKGAAGDKSRYKSKCAAPESASSPNGKRARGAAGTLAEDAHSDALAEAAELSQAVENAPAPPPSPPRTDRVERPERADCATAADRARALETSALRDAAAKLAAKAAADLARVMVELDKEKKKNHAAKAATPVTSPAPTSTSARAKTSAAAIRRQQVLSETLTFHMFETLIFFVYLCRFRRRNQQAAAAMTK